MKHPKSARPGFTLIEVVVVMVMMSILAAAGLVGFGAMVSHFQEQACMASRKEAAQAFISEWLEGDLPNALNEGFDVEGWLDGYVAENQVKDAENWKGRVSLGPDRKSAAIWIWCTRHRDTTDLNESTGAFGGDVRMEFARPELIE